MNDHLNKYFFQIVFAVCAASLVMAIFFQFVVGLHPCPLCLYQRWPYVIGLVVALLGWKRPGLRRLVLIEFIIIFSVNVLLGFYHVGIEQSWWEGFTACSGTNVETMEELINQIMTAPIVRCDEVQWSFLGLSLAAYSMLLSMGLTVFSVWRLRHESKA